LKQIKLGLLGLGNIGTGTYKALDMNKRHIEATTGLSISFSHIFEKDTERDRGIPIDKSLFTQDFADITDDSDTDIVIELIGGIDFATSLMLEAMKAGKHVVTANKAALAANFELLTKTASDNGVYLKYEASVGGGIPLIGAITESLCANEFSEVLGILNGTTNYILTKMTEDGIAYDVALAQAQEKGFAEPNPTADVEGIDAANKLSILISLVFGQRVHPNNIPTTGITNVSLDDIKAAEADGCVLKLIASAYRTQDGLSYFVQPTMLNKKHPLAGVSNEFNALFLKGNAVDDLMMYGKGAGPLPTASAVLGDVIDIGRRIK